jgi:hypothetical protein
MSAYTEQEAQTKWCPFARLSEAGGTFNREGPKADVHCGGSYCMAWRWQVKYPELPHASVWPAPKPLPPERTGLGFCGLAGSVHT